MPMHDRTLATRHDFDISRQITSGSAGLILTLRSGVFLHCKYQCSSPGIGTKGRPRYFT